MRLKVTARDNRSHIFMKGFLKRCYHSMNAGNANFFSGFEFIIINKTFTSEWLKLNLKFTAKWFLSYLI